MIRVRQSNDAVFATLLSKAFARASLKASCWAEKASAVARRWGSWQPPLHVSAADDRQTDVRNLDAVPRKRAGLVGKRSLRVQTTLRLILVLSWTALRWPVRWNPPARRLP
jgi:hypothetical protein